MERVRYGGTFIGLLRDHGHGRVEIDGNGQAVPYYDLTDELDVRNTHRAIDAQARLHAAAGAREIQPMAAGTPRWRDGDDLDASIERWQRVPLARRRLPALLRPPDGHLPDGEGRSRRASPTHGASCTTPRASGSATAAPSRPPPAPIR